MRVIDPGHRYEIMIYDVEDCNLFEFLDTPVLIQFMKREGEGYPGNVGKYPGTNCQELLRVLIDRVKYLDAQIPCRENQEILQQLRLALYEFEARAARCHGRELPKLLDMLIELIPTCSTCGHIYCEKHYESE